MPLSILPTEPRYWWATCAVRVPSLRSPVSSTTSAPPSCGAVAWFSRNNSTRRSLIRSWSQADSERNHCSRWTSRCWAPVIGSAPASPSGSCSDPLAAAGPAGSHGSHGAEQDCETDHRTGRRSPPRDQARAGRDGGRSSAAGLLAADKPWTGPPKLPQAQQTTVIEVDTHSLERSRNSEIGYCG